MHIDFVYQIDELGAGGKTLINSEFTIAYCTISTEYYKAEAPNSQEQPVSKTEPSATSTSAPAFTFIGAISVFALVFFLFRR